MVEKTLNTNALNKVLIGFLLLGVAAIILGGVFGFRLLPNILEEHIYDNVRLGLSDAYREWEVSTYDIETRVYSFSVSNPDDVMSGAYPKLIEKGPVVFKQKRIKDNIQYNTTSDTFTYDQIVYNQFDENSNTSLSETVVTLNLLKYLELRFARESGTLPKVLRNIKELFPDTELESLFHTVTFRQLLTEGYNCCRWNDVMTTFGQAIRTQLRSKLTGNTRFMEDTNSGAFIFSLFKYKTNYTENQYETHAGNADISHQGFILRINGLPRLNFWPKLHRVNFCNLIRGSDSYNIPPRPDFDAGLSIYNPDLCRSLDYAYNQDVQVKGVSGQRLVLMRENFLNSTIIRENKCYCMAETINQTSKTSTCLPSGFSDLSRCHGLPIIASQPHFLYANEKYSKRLSLKPRINAHLSYIDIHPISGTILRSVKHVQYNVKVEKLNGFYEPNDEFMFPLFWIEEVMEIPQSKIDILKDEYEKENNNIIVITWSLLGFGTIFILGSGIALILLKLINV